MKQNKFSCCKTPAEVLFKRRTRKRLNVPECLVIHNLQQRFGKFLSNSQLVDLVVNFPKDQDLFKRRSSDYSDCLAFFAREVPEIWIRNYLTKFSLFHHQLDQNFPYQIHEKLALRFWNFLDESHANQIHVLEVLETIEENGDDWNFFLNQIRQLLMEHGGQ